MKKIINKKHNKNEPWFKWLTRELNSYEAFNISLVKLKIIINSPNLGFKTK